MAGFEDDLKKLESVVERLERGDLTLEESVKLFEQGIQLSHTCKTELDAAEGKIQMLVKGKRGEMQPSPLQPARQESADADEGR
jgi:exodeoxyribonuclease VII small subunit